MLRPAGQLWTSRAQPWLRLPDDMLRYTGEPEGDDDLYAAYRHGHAGGT